MKENIDTEVVALEFDNKQFERNVEQSLGTLDKLKNALHFSTSTKGVETLQSAMSKFDTSGMQSAVDQVSVRWSAMQVIGSTALATLTNDAVNAGKRVAHALTSSITRGGWNRAMNLEQAAFQIRGLGYEWERYAEAFNTAVEGTAYGLDSAAKAGAQFLASGVTDPEKMGAYLRGISGVAAMTSSDYDSIAQIFTKVAGNGRLMGDELLQLSSRGINAAAALAKELGLTEAQVREMVTKGQIDFNTFASAMDNAFGEHAKKANETFTGALSNMKAALGRIGAKVATPLMENLRDVFNYLRVAINYANKALDPFIKVINDFQNLVTDRLDRFITGSNRGRSYRHLRSELEAAFGDDTQDILKDYQAALTSIVGDDQMNWYIKKYGTFEKAIENGAASVDDMAAAFENVASSQKYSSDEMEDYRNKLHKFSVSATDTGSSVNRWLTEMSEITKSAAWDILIERIEAAGETQDAFMQSLTDVGNARGIDIAGIIAKYGDIDTAIQRGAISSDLFRDALDAMSGQGNTAFDDLAADAHNLNGELGKMIDRLDDRSSLSYLGTIISNLFAAISKPIKIIGEAFNEVFGGFLFTSLNEVLNIVSDITDKLDWSEDLLGGIKSFFKGVLSVVKTVVSTIYKVVSAPMKVISSFLSGLWNGLGNVSSIFSWLPKYIGTALSKLTDFLDNLGIVETIVKFLQTAAYNIGMFIGNIIDSMRKSDTFVKILDSAKTLLTVIWSALSGIFSSDLFNSLLTGLSKLLDTIASIWDYVMSIPAVQRFMSGLSGYVTGFVDGIADVLDRVTTWFTNFNAASIGESFKEIGEYVMSGFFSGLANGLRGVFGWVEDVFVGLINLVCDILGIHSPSREFYEIGTNVVTGFLNGVLDTAGELASAIGSMFRSILDELKNLDFGKVAGGTLFGMSTYWLIKLPTQIDMMLDSVKDITKGVNSVLTNTGELLKKAGKVFDNMNATVEQFNKGRKLKRYEKILRNIALMIFALTALVGAIVGAFYVISDIDPDSINRTLIAISAVLAGLMALIIVASKIPDDKIWDTISLFAVMGKFIIALGASMILFSLAFERLGSMSWDSVQRGLIAMLPIFALLGVLVVLTQNDAFGTYDAGKMTSLTRFVTSLMTALMLFMVAFKIIGSMEIRDWTQSLFTIVVLIVAIAGLAAILSKTTIKSGAAIKNLQTIGAIVPLLLGLSALLLVITFVAKQRSAAYRGLFILAGLVLLLYAFMYGLSDLAAKFTKPRIANISMLMRNMTGVLLALAGVALLCTFVASFETASTKGLGILIVMTGLMLGFTYGLSKITSVLKPKDFVQVGKTILFITGAIGMLALTASVVGLVDFSTFYSGLVNLIGATALMLVLIAGLAAITKVTRVTEMIKVNHTLLYVVGTVGILAGLCLLVGMIDPKGFKTGIKVVGAAALMISGLMVAAGYMTRFSDLKRFKSTLITMTVCVGVLIGLMALLTQIDPVRLNAAASAIGVMSGALIAIMIATAVVANVGKISDLVTTIKMLGVALVVIALLGAMSVVVALIPTDTLIKMRKLTDIILELSLVMGALALLGSVASLIADGLVVLSVVTAIISGIGLIAGYIAEEFPEFGNRIQKGFDVLHIIAWGIGDFFGTAWKAFKDAGDIGDIGDGLKSLMDSMVPFAEKMSNLDEGSFNGLNSMIDALVNLGNAVFLEAMSSISGADFSTFAESLTPLADGLLAFYNKTSAIDTDQITPVANAIGVLSEACDNVSADEDALIEFGASLETIGTSIAKFADDTDDVVIGDNVKAAIQALVDISTVIPNIQGINATNMDTFENGIGHLASGLNSFVADAKGIHPEDVEGAFEVANSLIELGNTITSSEGSAGLFGFFGTDTTNLGELGTQFSSFGAGLAKYTESIQGVTFDADANSAALAAAKGLIELNNLVGAVGADITVPTFNNTTDEIKDAGHALVAFALAVEGIPENVSFTHITAVASAFSAVITSWPSTLPDSLNTSGLSRIVMLSNTIKIYATNLSGVDFTVIESSAAAMETLAGGLDALGKVKADEVQNAIDSISSIDGSDAIAKVGDLSASLSASVESAAAGTTDSFGNIGTSMATAMVTAITTSLQKELPSGITSAFNRALAKYVIWFNSAGRVHFIQTGQQAAIGFANGLNSKLGLIATAGNSLGATAIKAIKKILDIHSPSREMFKLGAYTGEGFLNGFVMYESAIIIASRDMHDAVVDGMNDTLSAIQNSDMQPVISPVMDLSNVTRGTDAIREMVNGVVGTSMFGNIGAISTMFNRNSDRATNDDVVHAVNKLNDSLENIGRPSISIRDITYDDGTNIVSAIEDIARYATVERRQ